MQVGEFKLWLQHGPLALLAAVVSGQPPPELRQVFARELEAIHREFGPALAVVFRRCSVGCRRRASSSPVPAGCTEGECKDLLHRGMGRCR